jgi:hypothetical protein
VPHIGDQGQPRGGFRGGGLQPGAVDGVVDHRAELMRGDARCKPAQRNLDVTPLSHIAPLTHPAIVSNPIAIIS